MLPACAQLPSAVSDTAEISNQPSLRGLSRVDALQAWVSGSGGAVARSADGGLSWQQLAIPETAELDFRDLHAFGWDEAVLMSAGPGEASRLYRTENAGKNWQQVAINQAPDGFWDGIAFWNDRHGLLVGDPVDGSLTIMYTGDGGHSWVIVPASQAPAALEGEYAFAASGTSVAVQPGGLAWIATGGAAARVFMSTDYGQSWTAVATPVPAGSDGAGIFSIAFRDPLHGVVVGGDYLAPDKRAKIAAYSEDGGRSWNAVTAGFEPGGYRSGLSWAPSMKAWIAVGPEGADFSTDDGRTWSPLPSSGFHSVDQEWVSGGRGRVGRVTSED